MSRASLELERKILRLLHGQKTRKTLREIHAHFLRQCLHQSNQILSHFVSVCGHLNKMDYANLVFAQTHNPNILLFNSMIKGYSLNGPFEEAIALFSLLKTRGIWPDEYTFPPLLKACSGLGDVRVGQCTHGEVIKSGFERFGSVQIGVVELYSSSGRMEEAKKVFDRMCQRDVIVWNLMIRGFCKIGDVGIGLNLFRQMSERSVVSWNLMISCLAQSARQDEALALFQEMRELGFQPDEATVVIVLPICAHLGAADVGQWIHSYAESSRLYQKVVSVGNALVDFYSKCGNLETALQIFKDMPCKYVVSWNVMISGLAFNGKGELGVKLFEEMMNKGEMPNDATFIGVLTCCAHAGLVEKGQELFASMSKIYYIDPKLEHYGCMVDLLARSGCVRMAYDLITSMHIAPNATLWGALLSACRTHGELQLAELAVKELMNLEPWNSGNYVLLSNIYAEEGRWDEVDKIRVLMREKSVKKAMGQSATG
ncbi:PREDICTED: pentatricopeptide repeat-containing protein At1g09190 [Theobroma cacao]|uniref:Pentatricopeptide repeat-containing protein At1g09190 n=2 Tax=Theobroma cacao TaxID=3641 RepID=A0AB32V595_THECC|nr:PREDICTED: pentatricopeptide repeat-containing protein At1g09190 [Theobroma cacao]EOY11630.1 Tetratricopeptide repeat (TPR)-like superfamily protein [Theobroma cacao]